MLHGWHAVAGSASLNTAVQEGLPRPFIRFKVVCSATPELFPSSQVNTPEGQRLPWLSPADLAVVITGTFTQITRCTVEVVISGQQEVWKQAARHFSGENLPKAKLKKGLLNGTDGCKWQTLKQGLEEQEVLQRMTQEAVYHKIRPPSTIINCRTILILKYGSV